MDVRQLNYFIVLAESNTISEAAKKLKMAQPPLSQMLKNLEIELGATLIKRSKKKHQLTKSGHILYQEALNILKQLEEMKLKIREEANGLSGNLRIGCNHIAILNLETVTSHFLKQFPNVSLIIEQNDSITLQEKLKNRTIDLAFLQGPIDQDIFTNHFSKMDEFVFVTSEELKQKSISQNDFFKKPLLLPDFHSLTSQGEQFSEILSTQPEAFTISYCSNYTLIQQLVANGIVNSFVPKSLFNKDNFLELFYYPLRKPFKLTCYHLISLKENYLDQTSLNFIETLKN